MTRQRGYRIFVWVNLIAAIMSTLAWVGVFQNKVILLRTGTASEHLADSTRFVTDYRGAWLNQNGLVCAVMRRIDDAPSQLLMLVRDPTLLDGISPAYRFKTFSGVSFDRRLTGAPILVIRYWAMILICGLLPVSHAGDALRWLKARKRVRDGCCPVCGYDLRATPDRCPECGNVQTKR